MDASQTIMCGSIVRMIADFYKNPENERNYQEWLQQYEEAVRGRATNENRARSKNGKVNVTTL